MNKVCIFITGTNAVGKSTLVNALAGRYEGFRCVEEDVTYLNDPRVCLAGRYEGFRYGGVDRLTNDKGSSCTSRLAEVVARGLSNCEAIFCEGSYINTFGINLSNALFLAQRQLVVFLYAPAKVLHERLLSRAGKGLSKFVMPKQQLALNSARKWASIGVPVLTFDSSTIGPNAIAEAVISKLNDLWKS